MLAPNLLKILDRERRRENHHPTVRGDPSAIERSCDLLAGNGWKGERKKPIVGHGGCGSARSSESDGFSTEFLRSTNHRAHARQRRGRRCVRRGAIGTASTSY
jgi:hypothetical protein